MLELNNLESLKKERKRRGRGGSRGGTAGRGHKGQRARSGGKSGIKAFFEGGQMSLTRRLPRRGFTNNPFRVTYACVNLSQLDAAFNDGDVVTEAVLREKGLVKAKRGIHVKVLGNGSLTKALTVQVAACTKGAQSYIEQSGGSVQLSKEIVRDSTTA